MTLSTLARLLIRRWYVALLGLVMTGALAGVAVQVVKPEYNAAGSILLLPPANPGANPYLDLAAVPGVPEVISRVLHDSKYADKYAEEGIEDYEVSPDQSAGGPAVLVIGRGETEDESLTAMLTVMADVLPVLQELQDEADVDRPNLITGRQIYVETEATKAGKAQTRAVVAAVGLGLVLTLFLVAALDALLGRPSARRGSRTRGTLAQSAEVGAGPPDDECRLRAGPRGRPRRPPRGRGGAWGDQRRGDRLAAHRAPDSENEAFHETLTEAPGDQASGEAPVTPAAARPRRPAVTSQPVGSVDPDRGGIFQATLLIVLLLAIPSKLHVGALGSAGTPAQLMALLVVLVWVLGRFFPRTSGSMPRLQPLHLALAGFVAATLASLRRRGRATDPRHRAQRGRPRPAGGGGVGRDVRGDERPPAHPQQPRHGVVAAHLCRGCRRHARRRAVHHRQDLRRPHHDPRTDGQQRARARGSRRRLGARRRHLHARARVRRGARRPSCRWPSTTPSTPGSGPSSAAAGR